MVSPQHTNPFSEGHETQLYYDRGKSGVPREKTAARAQRCESQTLFGITSRPGGKAITPTNLTTLRVASQRLASSSEEE